MASLKKIRLKPHAARKAETPARPRFLSLIDLGLDMVKIAVVDVSSPQEIRVLGHSVAETHGRDIAGGRATAAALTETVNYALQEAEDATESAIGRKVVPDDAAFLLPGRALVGQLVAVEQRRPPRSGVITQKELDTLWQRAAEKTRRALAALPDVTEDWTAHTVTPGELRLDGRLVNEPVGLNGRKLTLSAYGTVCHPATLRGIEQLAERLELNIAGVVPVPQALATLVSAADALVLHVGASGTDCLRVRYDALAGVETVPFGGEFFSRQLSQCFNCAAAEAEALKIAFSTGALTEHDVSLVQRGLTAPLRRWAEEVVVIIGRLFPAEESASLPAHIYFTGGSAGLPGLKNMLLYTLKDAGRTFDRPVEIINLGETALSGFRNHPSGFRGMIFAPVLSSAKFL